MNSSNKASRKVNPSSMQPSDYILLSTNADNTNPNSNSFVRKQIKYSRISGDGNLYQRVYEVIETTEFNSAKSIVKFLQQKFPEYKRKKDNVFLNSVQKVIDQIDKNLQNNTKSSSDEEVVQNSTINREKEMNNSVNKSLNNLYLSQKSQARDMKNQQRKSKVDREADDFIKNKKARTEADEEQKADKAIEVALAKQVKLQEKYLLTPKVTFSDFGGIQDVVVELKRLVYHIQNSELYRQLGVEPPRGFLLHGPPGVGKSQLVEALASDLQIPCLRCGATEIIAGISGESEEKIRELFSLAKSLRPCLLFIDEIDAITPKRENAAREMERRIVTQLLTCLDKLADSDGSGDGVMVIGATNRADALDPALRRAGRFDREIALGIPDESARLDILKVLCRNIKIEENFDFEALAHRTPGYVGADLKSLIREAAISALERYLETNHSQPSPESFSTPFKSEEMEVVQEEISASKEDGEVNHKNVPINLSALGSSFRIKMQDFEIALKQVQPSSKREGFATVPDVTWEDIGALTSIRQELQLSILAPVRYPTDVKRLGLSLSAGILLCGPPGCGKTLLAKAVANESGINFISVKGPELLNMYVGESERAVRAVFNRARNSKPCVIFFDEIDALCPKRNDSDSSNVTSRVVNQLLTEMDGLESRNCFMLAATNRPDIIDPAILRPGRFDKVLYVDFPSPDDRYEILWKLTKKGTKPPLGPDVDLKTLANDQRFDGFTGADLSAVIREASFAALRERISGEIPVEQNITLQNSHFNLALDKVRPSVSKQDRAHYRRMIEVYSNSKKLLSIS